MGSLLTFLKRAYMFCALALLTYVIYSNYPSILQALEVATKVDTLSYVLVLLAASLSFLFRTIRWVLFIRNKESQQPFYVHSIIYLSGFAFTATPAKAGELMRGVQLTQYNVPFSFSFCSFFSERLLDLIIVLCLASYSLHYLTGYFSIGVFTCALISLPFVATKLLQTRISAWVFSFLSNISSLRRDLMQLWQSPLVVKTVCLTFLTWSAQGCILYLLLIAMGCDILIHEAISIYCLSLLVGAATLIPGGIGITEASMAWIMTQFGIPKEHAIMAALLTRSLTLWPAILIGIVCTYILRRK